MTARKQARKSARRTQEEMANLRGIMTSILADDHPQSVRHVFYRMTDPTLFSSVEKTDNGYVTIQRLLTKMRREGLIPYGWISDASRAGYFTSTFNSPGDAIEHTAQFYRRSYWSESPAYVEVWCESRSIAGVIRRTCEEYAVPLYPSGGFSSLSFVYDSAVSIEHNAGDRPINVLYIGDYDPAGVLIDKKIEQELRGHLPDHAISFHRLGINPDQIDLMGLPTKPAKTGDKRRNFKGFTVEAEAMPANIMRSLLRDAIEQFIDPHELAVLEEAEKSERFMIERLAGFARHHDDIGEVFLQ